jgi:mannosyltransferase OCH1-like enzyme
MQCGVSCDQVQEAPDQAGQTVPKLIMQTWKSEGMSETWRRGQQSVLKHFPDWQYVFLTDAAMHSFVVAHFPDLHEAFCALPYNIQRADVLRYLWLYKYGGLYLDLDYEVLRPFDGLLETINAPLFVLYSANVRSVLTNSLIVAKPGLEVLYTLAKTALGGTKPWWALSRHVHVMSTTGPLAFHKAITRSPVPFTVLPESLFLQGSPMLHDVDSLRKRAISGATAVLPYTVPLDGGSWNATDTTIINFLNKHKWILGILLSLGLLWSIIHGAHSHVVLRALQHHLRRALRLKRVTRALVETLEASG